MQQQTSPRSLLDLDSIAAAAADIQRAKSAPPSVVQINPHSLFAFSSQPSAYASLFSGDIRTHEQFELFAETYSDQARLPPPLEFSVPLLLAPMPATPDRAVRSPVKSSVVDQQVLKQIWESPVGPSRPQPSAPASASASASPNRGSAPCRYFLQGHCSRGASCPFSHSVDSAAPVPAVEVTQPQTSASGGARRNRSRKALAGLSPQQAVPVASAAPMATLDQAVGRMHVLARDQWGCRFLQAKLDESPGNTTTVLEELFPHLPELMTDPFGNYLCQKLLERSSDAQRCAIIREVTSEIIAISLDMHGTRAVQKIIESVRTVEEAQLIRHALQSSVVPLIKDLNGNHVIQRCLHHLGAAHNQFIFDAVAAHCVEVATHRHGCCVLQRCIDYATSEQKMQLIAQISVNARTLVRDPFGNYVVQYALDQHIDAATHAILSNLAGCLGELSTQKFSSNVVEKCLRMAPPDLLAVFVAELSQLPVVTHLMSDPFGNYVIQTVLVVCEQNPPLFHMMAEAVQPVLAGLRNTPQGKRIAAKLERP
eukprot:TRINITY_DN1186_c1_g1_i1.p1 TRINITY_DN1186_c1_g1~~TRINITY_DN1186_c1_g1_i1.p1  ORF type:complete len:539 (-),score=95.59 TRINITY_DN1186_c1_g1_i1:95-1711(-)